MLAVLLAQLALVAAPPVSTLAPTEAMKVGLQHYRDADFEGAIPYFQRTITALPDDEADKKPRAQAQIWLGLAFLNIGNAELAKQSFRAALLADPTARLPDEAPPAAIPMYANIKGDLERSAPKPKEPPKEPAKPPKELAQKDVPAATHEEPKHPDVAPHPDQDQTLAPDLTAPEEPSVSESTPFSVPRWVPQALGGVGAGLLLGGGYFKLASSSSFDDAANEPNAAKAAQLSHHADSQQHLARGLAIGGLVSLAAGTVLYFLNE